MSHRVLACCLVLAWLVSGYPTAPGPAWCPVAHAEVPDESARKKSTKKSTQKSTKKSTKKKSVRKKSTRKKSARKKSTRKKSTRKKSTRKKSARKTRRRGKKRSNMPRGWQWPPSKAMKKEGERCLAHLTELGVSWKSAKRTRKVATPIVVPDMVFGRIRLEPTFRKPPFVMDCLLAEALTEHSQTFYDQGVRVLRFSSIHSYRKARANGVTRSSLSRHALGLAVDVYELVMDGNVTLVVEDDYRKAGSVLPSIEDAANRTGGFRNVLSPGNDPTSHHDHFHFAARMPRL